MAAAWEELQVTLSNVSAEQGSVFNTILGNVLSEQTSDIFRQTPSEVPSSLNVHYQIHHVDNNKDFSQLQCFFLHAAGGIWKTAVMNEIQNWLNVQARAS